METWLSILGWFLSILTITGNGFIIYMVMRKRHLRTKTNAFIVSLAVADLCVGMVSFPSRFFCELVDQCDWSIYFLRGVFVYASATNLCSLVLDRYMAVAKALTYLTFMKRRRVIQMICVSWVIPVSFSVIVVAPRRWFNLHSPVVYNIIGWLYTVFEIILCAIVVFCFSSMLHVVWKQGRSARRLAKQLRFNHHVVFKTQDKSAVKMMAIVVGLFLLCYGIFLRCGFLRYFNKQPCNDFHYKIPIQVLNSAVNPLAYAIFKRDIKKEFRRLIHL